MAASARAADDGYAEELQRALKARINVLAKPFSEEKKLNLALHEALARSANL